jgi:hypothetical protein
MPKETVYGVDHFSPETSGAPGENNPPVAVVGWDREQGFVQLVTRRQRSEVPTLEQHEAGIPCEYGYYVELDRRAINDLIRHLRRARDSAFGRDE